MVSMKSDSREATASSLQRLGMALLVAQGTSLVFFLMRILAANTVRYSFLSWNLILADVPLILSLVLVRRLAITSWLTWQNMGLTILWLGFLPNSFYLVSDLIHLEATGEVGLLYDIVLFMSFIFNAYTVGFISLYIVHRQLLKRITDLKAHSIIAGVLLLCGFAIYLGRTLRWNSWDILVSPIGLLFDISDRFINPGSHPQSFVTTMTFFLLLGTMYVVIWQLVAAVCPTENEIPTVIARPRKRASEKN